jgi:hypothetical protein
VPDFAICNPVMRFNQSKNRHLDIAFGGMADQLIDGRIAAARNSDDFDLERMETVPAGGTW